MPFLRKTGNPFMLTVLFHEHRKPISMNSHLSNLLQRVPALAPCLDDIQNAYETMRSTLAAGGKLLLCGNGGSGADAEHWAGELLKGFGSKRPIGGDLHQPLHTADRHDRGGNDVKITPLLADEEAGPSNLHAFWDGAYRYDARGAGVVELWTRPGRSFWPRASREPGVIAAQADLLLKEAPPAESAVATSRQPWRDWARETHALACQSGWPDEAKTANRGPVTLRPGFVHEAHRIAEQQIVNAGERLAALLNDLLGGQAK